MRMQCKGGTYYAKVEGHEVMYEGRSVSPGSWVNGVAKSSRNAWRDTWIKRPGSNDWTLAATLRDRSATDNNDEE